MSIEMKVRIKKFAILTGLVFGYVLLIKYVLPVIWPLVVGFIIAKAISPLVKFLKKHLKIADGIASAIILTVVTGLICGILILFGILLYRWIHEIILNRSSYEKMFYNYCDNIFFQLEETFDINHGIIREKVSGLYDDGLEKMISTIFDKSVVNSVGIVKDVINIFIAGIVLYACTVLMAKDMDSISHKLASNAVGRDVILVYDNVKKVVLAYAKSQMIIMFITAVICSIVLMILKVDNGLLIGILVGFLDALPMIGVGILFIPWSILSLLSKKYFMAFMLFVAFVICNIVRELLEPKLMGNKIGIHPVVTLAAIFVGYNLFGVIGFVLGPIGFIIIKTIYLLICDMEKTA